MSQVVIELADEGGSVKAGITFIGGYNRYSNSHNVANNVMKHLDAIMKREETATTEVAAKLGLASV
jgi:hypothetical protein